MDPRDDRYEAMYRRLSTDNALRYRFATMDFEDLLQGFAETKLDSVIQAADKKGVGEDGLFSYVLGAFRNYANGEIRRLRNEPGSLSHELVDEGDLRGPARDRRPPTSAERKLNEEIDGLKKWLGDRREATARLLEVPSTARQRHDHLAVVLLSERARVLDRVEAYLQLQQKVKRMQSEEAGYPLKGKEKGSGAPESAAEQACPIPDNHMKRRVGTAGVTLGKAWGRIIDVPRKKRTSSSCLAQAIECPSPNLVDQWINRGRESAREHLGIKTIQHLFPHWPVAKKASKS